MEAYVLGVVYHDHSNFLHDAKIRIFDNSPSAKVTLYDYPIDAVVRAMKSGSLAIEGLHFSQSFSKPCAGGQCPLRLHPNSLPLHSVWQVWCGYSG